MSSDRRRQHSYHPKRGGPAMLLTCETGRERKCRHQGLEILRYYWDRDQQNATAAKETKSSSQEETTNEPAPRQSLDEELASLKEQANKHRRKASNNDDSREQFAVYETGCRGTVFVLCTNTGLVKAGGGDTKEEGAAPPAEKKQRTEENGSVVAASKETSSSVSTVWDPIQVVQSIVQDTIKPPSSEHIPSSRFISRVIPIQATCFASLDEIGRTVETLLQKYGTAQQKPTASRKDKTKETPTTTAPTTFAIKVKKRNCGTFQSKQVIDCVATVVSKVTTANKSSQWKVDLSDPDLTIQVEVCKTLAGISILPRSLLEALPNLNLAELRIRLSCRDDEPDANDNAASKDN